MHASLIDGRASLGARATLAACAALVLVWSSCGGASKPGAGASTSELPRAGEPTAEEQSCWKDSECALVEDCCGCAAGGLRLSVRADRVAELDERSASTCEQKSCPNAPSQHRSCGASAARCAGGRCIPAL